MAFEQATIKVEREQEFEELRAAIVRVFAPGHVEQFLKRVKGKGLRIRDFEAVLAQRVLETVDKSEINAQDLYQALTVSDRAQMREFYLFKLEEVSQQLRTKYQKIYRYY